MGLFSCGPREWWNSKQTFFLCGRRVLHHSDWGHHCHLCCAAITGGYGRRYTRSSTAGTTQRVEGESILSSVLVFEFHIQIWNEDFCHVCMSVFSVSIDRFHCAPLELNPNSLLVFYNTLTCKSARCQFSGLKCCSRSKLLYEEAPCKNLTPEGPILRHCYELSYRVKFATFALGPIIFSPHSQQRFPHQIWITHIGEILADPSWLQAPAVTGHCHLLFSLPLVKRTRDAVAAPVIRAFLQPQWSSSRANPIRPPVYRHANRI